MFLTFPGRSRELSFLTVKFLPFILIFVFLIATSKLVPFNFIVKEKGIDTIRSHAYDFINSRLKPKLIPNDGKQTPMRGHPVFIAEHATGTCCRNCLYKWHHIPKDRLLTNHEIDYIVNIIMKWIEINYKNLRGD